MTHLYDQNLNKVLFDGFYSRILQVVARALSQTKLFSFDICYLQGINPSYQERAGLLNTVHEQMKKLAPALGFIYQFETIGEYVLLMQQMADAIDAGDEDELKRVIAELDKKPFFVMQ